MGVGVAGVLAVLGLWTASDASAVSCTQPPTLVVAPGQRVTVSVTGNCTGAASPMDFQMNVTHHPQHGYLESPILWPAAQEYVAPTNYTGADQFSYTASRSAGAEPSAEITQHIIVGEGAGASPVCSTPSATPTVRQGAPKTLFITCSDPEGDPLTLSVVGQPSRGTVTVVDAHSVRYATTDPGADDSFSVRASDASSSSTPVEVHVHAVSASYNTPPSCVSDVAFSVHAGESGGTSGVLCTDAEGDPITYRITRWPTQGDVTPMIGVIGYDAPKTASGSDDFAFVAYDGLADAAPTEASVDILPRRTPACETLNFENEHTAYLGEDRLIRLSCRPGNDGLPVHIVVDGAPTHGTLTLDSANDTTVDYRYRPDSGYHGTDELVWHGVGPEGLASGPQTFGLTVTDRPANAAPECYSGSENGGTVRAGATKVLGYLCSSPEPGDDYAIEVVTPPAHGQIVATTYATPNNARISYRPDAGYDGLDSFQTRVSDGRGGVSATRDTRVMVVRSDYNRPPRCTSNGAQVAYGTSATLNSCADPDEDAFTFSLTGQPSIGSAAVSPDGNGVVYTAPASGPEGLTPTTVTVVLTDALGASRTWTYGVNVGTPCYPCGGGGETPPSGAGGGSGTPPAGGGGSPAGGGGGAGSTDPTTPAPVPPADTQAASTPSTSAPPPVTPTGQPPERPTIAGLSLGDTRAELPAGTTGGPVDVRGSRPATLAVLRCATDCSIVATPKFLGARKVAGTTQRLTVKAGRSGKLVVRVPAAVRRSAPKSGRVRVDLQITVRHADGSTSVDLATFTLRVRR